jgi:hypothetical protein
MVPNTRHKWAHPLELDTITSYSTCTTQHSSSVLESDQQVKDRFSPYHKWNECGQIKILLLVNFLKERKWVGLEFGVAKHACDHNLEPCASFNHFFFLLLSFVTFTCVNCARRYILAYSGGGIATNIPTSALWAIDKLHFQTWIIVFNRPI